MICMMELEIFKKVDMGGCAFIEGFPGAGLVGPMAISFMINKLGLEYIGYIKGDAFPPLISIHEDMPLPPSRFYYSKKHRVVALFAESGLLSEKSIYEISGKLYDFIKTNKLSQIISISGVPVESPEDGSVFAVVSTSRAMEGVDKAGLKKVGEGVAAGISALLLMYASFDGIDDVNLLVPVNPQLIDPRYAELAIESINKLLGLDMDVSELEKSATEVEQRIKDIVKKSKETKEGYSKGESGPSMYA